MKRIWARIGMSLEISDEEYEKLVKEYEKEYGYDFELEEGFASRFVKEGRVDGDSYIPGSMFENS